MRKVLLMLLMTGIAGAQTTATYSGVIKDLTQQVVTSGQVSFTLSLPTDSTIPGVGRFTPTTINCNINTDGTLSGYVGGVVSGACKVTLNTAISPTGTAYRVCIQAYFVTPGSCFYDYAINDKDITTVVPTLSTGPVNYGGVPGPPLNFLGVWSASTVYTLGQAVSSANAVYISLVNPNLNHTPASSPTFWSVVQTPASIIALPTTTQTVAQPTATTFATTVAGGISTGMTSNTPLTSIAFTDNSALATSGTMQGDIHLTPYHRADIQNNGPNDMAAYYNMNCNYTGGGLTGNCIPAFFIAGNTAADKHTGIWGGNSIVAEHANTLSFGWEINTFNFAIDGDILANGAYSAGPFFGYSSTASAGTGFFRQQAAYIASNNRVNGGAGGGWNNGLFVTDAVNAAVLCGQPSNGSSVGTCTNASQLGTATASNNYGSVPSVEFANTWTGSGNGIRSAQTQLIPGTGTNPIVCKEWKIDGAIRFDMCSDGTLQINGGSNTIFRCTAAGALPVGSLTSTVANCGGGAGGAADTGLRTN